MTKKKNAKNNGQYSIQCNSKVFDCSCLVDIDIENKTCSGRPIKENVNGIIDIHKNLHLGSYSLTRH